MIKREKEERGRGTPKEMKNEEVIEIKIEQGKKTEKRRPYRACKDFHRGERDRDRNLQIRLWGKDGLR